MIQFLSRLTPFVYYAWPVLLFIHYWLNYHIYETIDKEEFEGSTLEKGHRYEDNVLALLTFRWRREYMEDEAPDTVRLMRYSNVLSIVLIVYTMLMAGLWIYLYGKK